MWRSRATPAEGLLPVSHAPAAFRVHSSFERSCGVLVVIMMLVWAGLVPATLMLWLLLAAFFVAGPLATCLRAAHLQQLQLEGSVPAQGPAGPFALWGLRSAGAAMLLLPPNSYLSMLDREWANAGGLWFGSSSPSSQLLTEADLALLSTHVHAGKACKHCSLGPFASLSRAGSLRTSPRHSRSSSACSGGKLKCLFGASSASCGGAATAAGCEAGLQAQQGGGSVSAGGLQLTSVAPLQLRSSSAAGGGGEIVPAPPLPPGGASAVSAALQPGAWAAASQLAPPQSAFHASLLKAWGSTISLDGLDDDTSTPVCSICLSGYKDGQLLTTLPCGHAYHRDCIVPWLLQQGRLAANCPLCKADVFAA